MYVLGATDDRRRRLLMGFSVGVAALLVAVAVGVGRGGLIEGWRPVLIALIPPFLLVVASAVDVLYRYARSARMAAQWIRGADSGSPVETA